MNNSTKVNEFKLLPKVNSGRTNEVVSKDEVLICGMVVESCISLRGVFVALFVVTAASIWIIYSVLTWY